MYLLFALALVLIMITLYGSYQKSHNHKKLVQSLGLLLLLLILTYSTKILLIYKPLLVLHIALLIVAWWHYYRYIFKDIFKLSWMLSPLLSLGLFVLIALFFRENG